MFTLCLNSLTDRILTKHLIKAGGCKGHLLVISPGISCKWDIPGLILF